MAALNRTRTEILEQEWEQDQQAWGSSNFIHSSGAAKPSYTRKIQSGYTNTQHQLQIARHENASTAYSMTTIEPTLVSTPGFTCTAPSYPYKGQSYTYFRRLGSVYSKQIPDSSAHATFDTSETSDLDNQAYSKIWKKIEALTSDPQTLPALYEARELGKLAPSIQSGFTGLATSLFALTRGNFSPRNLKKLIRSIQDLWLTWSFGMSPMFEDGRQLAEAFANSIEDLQPRFQVVKTSYELDKMRQFNYGGWDFSSYTNWVTPKKTSTIHTKLRVGYQGGLMINNTPVGSFDRVVDSFNLTDFVPSVWEVIPFSWLVDYFTNVGDVLNFAFKKSPQFIYLDKTFKYETDVNEYQYLFKYSGLNSIYSFSSQTGQMRTKVVTFTRTPITSQPLPHPVIRVKDAGQISDWYLPKLLNLISLIKPR